MAKLTKSKLDAVGISVQNHLDNSVEAWMNGKGTGSVYLIGTADAYHVAWSTSNGVRLTKPIISRDGNGLSVAYSSQTLEDFGSIRDTIGLLYGTQDVDNFIIRVESTVRIQCKPEDCGTLSLQETIKQKSKIMFEQRGFAFLGMVFPSEHEQHSPKMEESIDNLFQSVQHCGFFLTPIVSSITSNLNPHEMAISSKMKLINFIKFPTTKIVPAKIAAKTSNKPLPKPEEREPAPVAAKPLPVNPSGFSNHACEISSVFADVVGFENVLIMTTMNDTPVEYCLMTDRSLLFGIIIHQELDLFPPLLSVQYNDQKVNFPRLDAYWYNKQGIGQKFRESLERVFVRGAGNGFRIVYGTDASNLRTEDPVTAKKESWKAFLYKGDTKGLQLLPASNDPKPGADDYQNPAFRGAPKPDPPRRVSNPDNDRPRGSLAGSGPQATVPAPQQAIPRADPQRGNERDFRNQDPYRQQENYPQYDAPAYHRPQDRGPPPEARGDNYSRPPPPETFPRPPPENYQPDPYPRPQDNYPPDHRGPPVDRGSDSPSASRPSENYPPSQNYDYHQNYSPAYQRPPPHNYQGDPRDNIPPNANQNENMDVQRY